MTDAPTGLTIWVDADGVPTAVTEVVLRAADKRQVPTVIVANRQLPAPRSRFARAVRVGAGFDVADDYIAERCAPGDLVITNDLPLAAQVIDKGATALQHRGEVLTAANVRQRLAVRDMLEELRGGGVMTGGPPPYGPSDKQAFANALDRFLTAATRP
jgi:uncharacterized protein YaiI (UPF0178 family)